MKVSGKVFVNISIEIDESILGILRKMESCEIGYEGSDLERGRENIWERSKER